jgi:hypothetical protein
VKLPAMACCHPNILALFSGGEVRFVSRNQPRR